MRIMLAGLCLLIVVSIIALLTTSSGIMIYQVKAGDGYFCRYFTGIGSFTTPSYAVTGCPRFISVNR